MRSLIGVMLAAVLVGGATIAADRAEAGPKHRRGHDRYERRDRDYDRDDHYRRGGGHFSTREVRVIREYYGPRYRPAPGFRGRYYRSGYLPHGWHHRVRPIPVYVERELVVLPHGYHRGIIDGHAVVYNSRGLIIDVAVLF